MMPSVLESAIAPQTGDRLTTGVCVVVGCSSVAAYGHPDAFGAGALTSKRGSSVPLAHVAHDGQSSAWRVGANQITV